MSLKDEVMRRVLSEEEAAKAWIVTNTTAIITHASVFVGGLLLGWLLGR